MNNPDQISESLETVFWVKILKLFDANPGSGMEKIWFRDKYPVSATLNFFIANPNPNLPAKMNAGSGSETSIFQMTFFSPHLGGVLRRGPAHHDGSARRRPGAHTAA
jgi:hypothetical protein